MRSWWKRQASWLFLAGILLVVAWFGVSSCIPVSSSPRLLRRHLLVESANSLETVLPPLRVHALPPSLTQWQDPQRSGDYFDVIIPSPVGYLIWSELPIKIYFDHPANPDDPAASTRRFQQWVESVKVAIAEWNAYLPLVEVNCPELADIRLERAEPPIGATFDPTTGQSTIARARSAQTRYEFYLQPTTPERLRHRMNVKISPGLSQASILSATRHELGHALGIWGHSPDETDALYFSQVRNSPSISARDINTLRKIYQQPTRLGWPLSSPQNN